MGEGQLPLRKPPRARVVNKSLLAGVKKASEAKRDRERGSAQERGYDARWMKEARAFRRLHPICSYCKLQGRLGPAQVVDHLYPHKQDQIIFWLKELWVSSCFSCHDGFKQAIERQGTKAIDALARRLGIPTLSEVLVKRERHWLEG